MRLSISPPTPARCDPRCNAHGNLHAATLRRFGWLAAALLCSAAGAQHADPTRPPTAGDTARVRIASGAASSPAPAVEAPRLQSVQIGAQGDASALIDGTLVRVGDRVGPHTVSAIDASGVELRGPRGKTRLTLANDVVKTPLSQSTENARSDSPSTPPRITPAPERAPIRLAPTTVADRKQP